MSCDKKSGIMEKILVVLPVFSEQIFNIDNFSSGCEYFSKEQKELLDIFIKEISRMYNVDLLTSTSKSIYKWKNDFSADIGLEENCRILRFPIERETQKLLSEERNNLLQDKKNYIEEINYQCNTGPFTPQLFDYCHRNYSEYKAIIFVGIDFYTGSVCPCGIPNSILIPFFSENSLELLEHGYFENVLNSVCIVCIENEEVEDIGKFLPLKNFVSMELLPSQIYLIEKSEPSLNSGCVDFQKNIEPAFEKNNIAVVFASDNRYVPIMSVAIQSVIETSSKEFNYDIIILSDGILMSNRRKIYSAIEKKENFSIRFVDVSCILSNYAFSFTNSQLSRSTFSRLAVQDILKCFEKVLYLDGDIICKCDISQLYDIDINGMLVGAIKDVHIDIIRSESNSIREHIENNVKLASTQEYFNAGILIFNLTEFRKKTTVEELFEIASKCKWMWEDQDVLNYVCRGFVKFLPQKWNTIWIADPNIEQVMKMDNEYFYALNNPAILHYAGGRIPIVSLDDMNSVDFWKIARLSPFYENLVQQSIKKFFEINPSLLKCIVGTPIENNKPYLLKNIIKKLLIKLHLLKPLKKIMKRRIP